MRFVRIIDLQYLKQSDTRVNSVFILYAEQIIITHSKDIQFVQHALNLIGGTEASVLKV